MESRASGTKTQVDQWSLEQEVGEIYAYFQQLPPRAQSIQLVVHRNQHLQFLIKSLRKLGQAFSCLDANRPWLCYWIIHSIALLRDSVDEELENNTVDFLSRCQDPEGGYGGGPGQMPHLATTYAAVNTLITLGGDKALSSINRKQLYTFFMRMKDTSGGFRMHDGGEIDVRASYTAISHLKSTEDPQAQAAIYAKFQVASVLNILDDQLVQNVGNYIISCQTYEGGIAGEPHSEAHGGYTFCGLAAMILIDEVHRLDLAGLIDWVVFKQGVEGGFKGRTNKLVDGCYSFWLGAVAAVMQRLDSVSSNQPGLSNALDLDGRSECDTECASSDLSDVEEHEHEHEHVEGTLSPVKGTCSPRQGVGQASASSVTTLSEIGYKFINRKGVARPLFSSMHLQHYLLLCSQVEGGFRDKPGKGRDLYHTCYCLSGLAICQYCCVADTDSPPLPRDVLGSYLNVLEPVHPLYGIVIEQYREAYRFFSIS